MFGCTCFVHNVSPSLDKFSAKATKCVFLKYSPLQKRYKCYSPLTKRYYIPTDVTFFEDTPLFFSSMEHCSFVQHVLPVPSCDSLIIPTSPQSADDIVPPPLLSCQHQAQITPSPLPGDPCDSYPPPLDSHTMDLSSCSPSPDSDHA